MSAPLQRRADVDPEPNEIENWRDDIAHATIRLDTSLGSRALDQRVTSRTTIALPIFIVLSGKRHSAILRNLSTSGAMIVTSAPLVLDMKIEFHCGAICALGSVVWQRRSGSGIKFDEHICERQLDEQVSRSSAVASWRKDRPFSKVA